MPGFPSPIEIGALIAAGRPRVSSFKVSVADELAVPAGDIGDVLAIAKPTVRPCTWKRCPTFEVADRNW